MLKRLKDLRAGQDVCAVVKLNAYKVAAGYSSLSIVILMAGLSRRLRP
jgi:hypothetical protein